MRSRVPFRCCRSPRRWTEHPLSRPALLLALVALLMLLDWSTVLAQPASRMSVDSAVSINQFVGQNAGEDPDIVVDVTASARLGRGWVAYIRPWFRRASTDPYEQIGRASCRERV